MTISNNREPYIRAQIEARNRSSVIKIKFLNFRSKYPDGLVLAVEGNEDKIVYSYWIARLKPDLAYEYFVCGGKCGVRQLCNSIAEDRGQAGEDLLLFVDRDFDDLIGFRNANNVFMLEFYAIENFLVTSSVLDLSLKVAYPGSGDARSRSNICRLFEADYDRFLLLSTNLNARIFVARRLRFDIDDMIPESLTHIANIKLGEIVPSTIPAEEIIIYSSPPKEEVERGLVEMFQSLAPRTRFRGKFALKFFRIWLQQLANEYRNPTMALFSHVDRDDGRIQHDELSLGSLASRSAIPSGLEDFLNRQIA